MEKMRSCCILGHRKIKKTNELKENVERIIIKMIIEDGVKLFLFGSNSLFVDMCYEIVTNLKNSFNEIKRVYVRAEYPKTNDEYDKYLERHFEESYYYDERLRANKVNYIKRNEKLINNSDFCLFYYDENYIPATKTKSGTKIAYEYARKKKKHIINVY